MCRGVVNTSAEDLGRACTHTLFSRCSVSLTRRSSDVRKRKRISYGSRALTLSKYLRLLLLVLAAALGALDSWTSRYSLNPMGVSYLDMGDAFVRRDWQTALNGLWSPLYSLPLGLLVRILKPSPSTEFPLVHFANFLIYLAALFAFALFMRELMRWEDEGRDSASEQRTIALPEWAMMALGYAVFIWRSEEHT